MIICCVRKVNPWYAKGSINYKASFAIAEANIVIFSINRAEWMFFFLFHLSFLLLLSAPFTSFLFLFPSSYSNTHS